MNDEALQPAGSRPLATTPGIRFTLTAPWGPGRGPHPGARPVVRKGDRVAAGQLLLEPDAPDDGPPEPEEGAQAARAGVPVHSPVSGKVVDVGPLCTPAGVLHAVTVESDGLDEWAAPLERPWDCAHPESWPRQELARYLLQAGLTGRLTAARPGDGSLQLAASLPALLRRGAGGATLVINAVGPEPAIPSEELEAAAEPDALVLGTRALVRALGAARAVVAVLSSSPARPAVEEALRRQASARGAGDTARPAAIRLVTLRELDWREVPVLLAARAMQLSGLGAAPFVVESAGTAVAAGHALQDGFPVTHRLLAVATGPRGPVRAFHVPIGLALEVVAAWAMAPKPDTRTPAAPGADGQVPPAPAVAMALAGGPLRGEAIPDLSLPVTASLPALALLQERHLERLHPEAACIRCGRCVEVCPVGLLPLYIARAAGAGQMAEARDLGALACVECAACAAVCPSRRPLLQWITLAKGRPSAPRRRPAERAAEKVATRS
ncbi:MAG: 4Fe-4S dicluster domain-containing protein [Limnochordaceae bacterium]|nr:4Fe-4S dicluster domain-containing protein [Limnochordaceae bacterium]